jgi:hypothetical protein
MEFSNERAALVSEHHDAIQRRSIEFADERQLFGVVIMASDLSLPHQSRSKVVT